MVRFIKWFLANEWRFLGLYLTALGFLVYEGIRTGLIQP